MQRRLFMMMPVIFFFFCYNFASALALYWTTSNIFAIVQMLITRRLPEPDLKKKKWGAEEGILPASPGARRGGPEDTEGDACEADGWTRAQEAQERAAHGREDKACPACRAW